MPFLADRLHELFSIDRTLVGSGAARFLEAVGQHVPLKLHRFPSGTECFDWTVPPAWELRRGTVKDPAGRVVIDTHETPLAVVNYSEPFAGRVSREDLLRHLHTSDALPESVPYRTSYYNRTWGFCSTAATRDALTEDWYDVEIDADFLPDEMLVGEVKLPGASEREIVFLSYCCHPRQANDGLSGVVALLELIRRLESEPRHYTYRFLFLPETIGSLAMCASGLLDRRTIEYAMVVTCVGVGPKLTFKQTFEGDHSVDYLAAEMLEGLDPAGECRAYWPHGSDERQLSSPGIQIPTVGLMRTPYSEFPEYHTSLDDLSFVDPALIEEAVDFMAALVRTYEGRPRIRGTVGGGEPFLSRHGLYQTFGGPSHGNEQTVRNWVLHLADGRWSAEDIARRSGQPLDAVRAHVEALADAGLVRND